LAFHFNAGLIITALTIAVRIVKLRRALTLLNTFYAIFSFFNFGECSINRCGCSACPVSSRVEFMDLLNSFKKVWNILLRLFRQKKVKMIDQLFQYYIDIKSNEFKCMQPSLNVELFRSIFDMKIIYWSALHLTSNNN
jgi:hypothetical protein